MTAMLTDEERRLCIELALVGYEREAAAVALNLGNLSADPCGWVPDAEGHLPLARISGLACPWDEVTSGVNIGGDARECFWKGAFSKSLEAGDEVVIDINHRPATAFARRGLGEVELWEAAEGLRLRCLIPDTDSGNEAMAVILAGKVSGLSIAFERSSVRYVVANAGGRIACVYEAKLLGVSICTDRPAYGRTAGTLHFERRIEK